MYPNDWVRVGAPLIEQDAEFLRNLIEKKNCPARLERLGDTDDGCSYVVLVPRRQLPIAHEVLAMHTTIEESPGSRRRIGRFGRVSLAVATGGFVVGAPLGAWIRDSVFMGVMAGAGAAMCAFLLVLTCFAARLADDPEETVDSTPKSPSITGDHQDSGRWRKAAWDDHAIGGMDEGVHATSCSVRPRRLPGRG